VSEKGILERLEKIDSRIIYTLLFLTVILPSIFPLGLPIKVSPLTQEAFEVIDSLPEGSKVLYHTCFEPGALGEMGPSVVATIKHLLRKNCKIYFIDMASGQALLNLVPPLMEDVEIYQNAVYDEDYLILGFFPGGEATAKQFASDVKSIVKSDIYGTPVENLKMMEDIDLVSDFDLILNQGECNPMVMYQWSNPYNVPTVMSCLVMALATNIMPAYEAGIIQGVIAGLRGGAEYEFLANAPGIGLKGLDQLSMSHILILTLLLIGNLSYVIRRYGGEEG
jgi:hypothetical protein